MALLFTFLIYIYNTNNFFKRRNTMKIQTGKFKGFAVIIASLAVLLAVSVLAVTVYAVTLENAGISPVAASVGGLVGDGGSQSHTITVNATYADAVSGETQTVELYADGATDTATDSGALADGGTVTFTTADATPSLNLKSSAKVSVSSVRIMDGETDVTIDQFGGQAYYDNFIESCKTSLFGYFELQSVAGDLTVNVVYGEPVTVSSYYYSATIVTKGYVGPIRNISGGDYQAVEFYSWSDPSIDSDGNLSGDYRYEYKTSTSASEYHMTEGGQLTRYVSGPRDYYLDMNNYSCIESVKLYNNSTGELISSDFPDITGEKVSCRQVLNYSPADSNDPTDITIVVTYKKAARIVGYKVSSGNAHDEAYFKPINLSSENGSDGIFFTGGDDSYLYSSSSGYENTELTTATGFSNSTLKLYHQNGYISSIKDVKVYSWDADGTKTDITGDSDKVTIRYNTKTGVNENGYALITFADGFKDDVYVEAKAYTYSTRLFVSNANAYSQPITISAADAVTSGIGDKISTLGDSYTYPINTSYAQGYIALGGSYTISYPDAPSGEKLDKATLKYYKNDGTQETLTFNRDEANGKIHFSVPEEAKQSNTSSFDLRVYFTEMTAPEAQVYIGYEQNGSFTSMTDRGYVQVTAYNDGQETNGINNTMDQRGTYVGSTNYSSIKTNATTSLSNSYTKYWYKFVPGFTYKVEDIYGSNAYEGMPDGLKKFIKDRLTLTDVKVYKVESFEHDYSGSAVLATDENGDFIETHVTKNADGTYSFVMPDYPVRIFPVYRDHIRGISVVTNENDHICNSARGTAVVTGTDDDDYFTSFDEYDSNYYTSSYFSGGYNKTLLHNEDYSYRLFTNDGKSFDVTATPDKDSNGKLMYYVKDVKLFYASKDNFTTFPNSNIKTTESYRNNIASLQANVQYRNWIYYDDEGNILNDQLNPSDYRITKTSEADENGAVSYHVDLLSDDLGPYGNLILYVEFEEVPGYWADFKYVADGGLSDIKISTTLDGNIKDANDAVTITNGAELKAAPYSADDTVPQYLTFTVGSSGEAAFYYTNLVYTISSYDGTDEYAKFRIFEGKIIPVGDTTEAQLKKYIDLDSVEYVNKVNNYSADRMTIKFMLPGEGLRLSYTTELTYIPFVVNQWVVDENGNESLVNSDDFTTDVYAYSNFSGVQAEFLKNKFFSNEYKEDYFSFYRTADAEQNYNSHYVAKGGETKVNRAVGAYYTGATVVPHAPEGYQVMDVTTRAYHGYNGELLGNGAYSAYFTSYDNLNREYVKPGVYGYYQNGYYGRDRYSRQEFNVYYYPKTTITVHQHATNLTSDSNEIAKVWVTNIGGTAINNHRALAYPDSYYGGINTFTNDFVTVSATRSNYETEDNLVFDWDYTLYSNVGVKPRFTVHPYGARYVGDIRFYKVVNGEDQELNYTIVSGTGYIDSDTVYEIDDLNVALGDDIHVDITYGSEQKLTVQAIMLDASNKPVTNDPNVSNMRVTVTGEMLGSSGEAVPCFKREGQDSFNFSEFTTTTEDVVSTYSSVGITLKSDYIVTESDPFGNEPNLNYIVAGVELYEGTSTTPLSAGVTPKIITYTDDQGNEQEGKDYSECTIAGLRPNTNTTIKVYFARTTNLRVSVYTIDSNGDIHDGVPYNGNVGAPAGAYVTVTGKTSITGTPFVTKKSEGSYCTSDFQFGYEPNYRDVSALQGSEISIFSMLPEEGDWFIKKIEGDGFTSTGISSVQTITNSDGKTFYRTKLRTNGTIYPTRDYEIKIYISKANLITTKAVTVSGNDNSNVTVANGTVRVYADDVEEGVVPFTPIYPTLYAYNNHYYDATYRNDGGDHPYSTLTKCIAGTKLHFSIVPDQNFIVNKVEFRLGGQDGELLKQYHSGSDYYIKTGTADQFTMPTLSGLYIYVEFKPSNTSRIYVDYQRMLTGQTDNNLEDYFGNYADGQIYAWNSNTAYNGVSLMNRVIDGAWYDPNSGSTYGDSANNYYFRNLYPEGGHSNYFKFDVVTGSSIYVDSWQTNDMWLTAVEFYVTDADGNLITRGSNTDENTKFSFTASEPTTYIVHARFIENSRILFRTIDLNGYDNVRQDGEWTLKDSEYGGYSQASREGKYYDIEDVELTDQYRQHISTATAKYDYTYGSNITSGNLYERKDPSSSLSGPFGFEGDRESVFQRNAFVMGDSYYPLSSWSWQTSRDSVALDGTSLTNINVDTSKMRVPVDNPVAGNGNITVQNRNQSMTADYPSGWDVVSRLYKIDKQTIKENPGLVRAIENLNPETLKSSPLTNKLDVVAEFDLTRDEARIYETDDYNLTHQRTEWGQPKPYYDHDNYSVVKDFMSKDLDLKLDSQCYYLFVVKYELIHVYTDVDASNINTYFATLHFHNNDSEAPGVGLHHDHDLINYNDIQEAFISTTGYTCANYARTFGDAENGYMDTRIPLYYGRGPGYNEVDVTDVSHNFETNKIFNAWYPQTYYVIELDKPKEEQPILSVEFYDYRSRLTYTIDGTDPVIVNDTSTGAMPSFHCWADNSGRRIYDPVSYISYRVVTDINGMKKYQYVIPMYLLQTYVKEKKEYVPTFGDTVLDNTLRIKIKTTVVNPTPPPPPEEGKELPPSELTVSQYDRISLDNYSLSTKDTAVITGGTGTIRDPGDNTQWISSVTLPQDTNSATSVLTVKRENYYDVYTTPRDGYVLEKIEYSGDYSTTRYPRDSVDGSGNHFRFPVSYDTAEIKIYYAHPILRVTVNNTADDPKAAVDAFDTGTEEYNKVRVLEAYEYTKDTNVEKGDEKTLKIIPQKYSYTDPDTGETIEKKYTVEYISVGDAYDTLIPVYDATRLNPQLSDDYILRWDEEEEVYYLTLKTITCDTYVNIQMKGETSTYFCGLETRHHIKPSDSDEYVNCSDENWGGNVKIYGSLPEVDQPLLDSEGNRVDMLELVKNEYSVSGSIQNGSALYLNITPPTYYKIDDIVLKYGNEPYHGSLVESGEHAGQYTFAGITAPESGKFLVDVYYSLNLTDYKLVYKYKSRFVNEGDGNYEDGKESVTNGTDREYIVNVQLVDTYVENGKPKTSVLVENAPAIDDLYKNCRWIMDSEHVQYDTENNVATITAYQPVKQYTVKFFKSEQEESKFNEITIVDRNSFAKIDGEFVVADPEIKINVEENGEQVEKSIPFAYWKIEDANSPIKNDSGEITGYKEIEKCFSLEFNYRVTQDIRVIPYYSADNVHVISIGDPEFTREQFTDENGDVKTDLLYADFILSYFDREKMILFNGASGKDYQSGLLLEFDKEIKLDKADEKGATLSADDIKYFDSDKLISEENLKKFISGDEQTKTKISEDYPNRMLFKFNVNNDSYNNKNRIDKALSFNNTENFRHYVFRAYYYVVQPDGTVELSDPVYFYLYDIGNSIISD